ncbi:MAG: alkaline phosphatase D family protein [Fuerstiella sp.]|nr:alkaline phosphatase D family protein [Fuerstiella sp.]
MKRILPLFVVVAFCGSVVAELPRVLIIGDSISLGYTPHVVRMLQAEAEVVHNRGNAQHSGTGIKKLENWLGDTNWDVIHFNWGLWDLCYRHPESKVQGRRDKVRGTLTTSPDQYEKNLDILVSRLRQTGAKLIWANTTVVPEGESGRMVNDDLKYNAAAARVMKKYGVETNDLNKLTRTFAPDLFTKPGDVHLKPEGYQQLAEQVVASIRADLPQKKQAAVVSRIMFGSCIKQDKPMPILGTIADSHPEVFIFLGDNIYGDTEDMGVLKAKYEKLGADAGFQRLRAACPTLATWDDHDFGVNDGGADYPKRKQSEQIFEDFWLNETHVGARAHPGVYDSHVFGPAGKRVQVILLDTRFFRSPLKRGDRRVGGPWLPDNDPSKTMLGDAQWNWLETQLRQTADVRIIASSIQFIAEDAGQETWSNLPRERQKMLDLLAATNATGVIFISGDRHWSELSSLERESSGRLLDLTSSSFNQIHPRGTPTRNRFRELPKTYHKENFGVINIAWEQPSPQVTLEIRDLEDEVQLSHKVRLP